MIYGIKIAQDAQCPEEGSYEEKRKVFSLEGKSFSAAHKNDCGKKHGYEIAKETFLYRRQIAGEFDEETHQRKKECRSDDEKYSFILLFHGEVSLLMEIYIAVFNELLYHTGNIPERRKKSSSMIKYQKNVERQNGYHRGEDKERQKTII